MTPNTPSPQGGGSGGGYGALMRPGVEDVSYQLAALPNVESLLTSLPSKFNSEMHTERRLPGGLGGGYLK